MTYFIVRNYTAELPFWVYRRVDAAYAKFVRAFAWEYDALAYIAQQRTLALSPVHA